MRSWHASKPERPHIARERTLYPYVEGSAFTAERSAPRCEFLLLIILILLLIGALPTWPYSGGWGYYPSGGAGLLVVILLVLILAGVL